MTGDVVSQAIAWLRAVVALIAGLPDGGGEIGVELQVA
jgi:hypothetical protein